MLIDTAQKILDLDNKDLFLKDDIIMTFGNIIATILLNNYIGEENLPAPEKLDRADLADKLYKALEPIEINNKEDALIMKLAEKALPTLTYWRINQIMVKARAESVSK